MTKKTLLVVSDAACQSGFARSMHAILDVAKETYDIYVLGINYRGDPHDYPYRIWAAAPGGDFLGVGRLIWMCDQIVLETGAVPDVILLQNDGWNIQRYMQQLRLKKSSGEYAWPDYASVPVVAICAVDGKNFQADWLEGVDHTIFWSDFALEEAREAEYEGTASVIPLGVDLKTFYPTDKNVARRTRGLGHIEDAFIIGNVNRNQPRKRWDLTIKYFAEWVYGGMERTLRTETADQNNMKIQDAYLYLHTAPTGDSALDVVQLCRYYKVVTRLILMQPQIWYGEPDSTMRTTYNCFDVAITTTQGEGFGLTAIEAMACGVPLIAPDWSALGEWTKGAAYLVKCTSTANTSGLNVIGGIPDQTGFISALNHLYGSRGVLTNNAQAALERAQEPRFRWETIGAQVTAVLESLVNPSENQAGLYQRVQEPAITGVGV